MSVLSLIVVEKPGPPLDFHLATWLWGLTALINYQDQDYGKLINNYKLKLLLVWLMDSENTVSLDDRDM